MPEIGEQCLVFTDLKRHANSMQQNKLFEVLENMNINWKYVGMIQNYMTTQ